MQKNLELCSLKYGFGFGLKKKNYVENKEEKVQKPKNRKKKHIKQWSYVMLCVGERKEGASKANQYSMCKLFIA